MSVKPLMDFEKNRKRKNGNKDDGLLPVPSLMTSVDQRKEIPSIFNAELPSILGSASGPGDGLLGNPMFQMPFQMPEQSFQEMLFQSRLADSRLSDTHSKPMVENTGSSQQKFQPRKLLIELYEHFLKLGWFNSYAGSVTVKQGKDVYYVSKKMIKDRIEPNDIETLDLKDFKYGEEPPRKFKKNGACSPLHILPHATRNAHAVIFLPSKNAVMVTLQYPGKEFIVTNFEMIKGVSDELTKKPREWDEILTIPIIENDSDISEVEQAMKQAISDNPSVPAVLIRRRGLVVWGHYWDKAKANAEALEYLFDIALQSLASGNDPSKPTDTNGSLEKH